MNGQAIQGLKTIEKFPLRPEIFQITKPISLYAKSLVLASFSFFEWLFFDDEPMELTETWSRASDEKASPKILVRNRSTSSIY